MKWFMATINLMIFVLAVLLIIVLLTEAQFGTAWLMVIPALYSGGNFWAIISDD